MKDDQALRVHERLTGSPLLCPVTFGEGRRFGLWDLASLAEGALGEWVDPGSLTVSTEKRLRLRLGAAGREYTRDDEYRRRYWIRTPGHDGEAVGTIAVDTWPTGVGALRVSSLYVHPVARRRGLASAALDAVYAAAAQRSCAGFAWTRTGPGRRLSVTTSPAVSGSPRGSRRWGSHGCRICRGTKCGKTRGN
ncbi:GNAT family N-acetyltransferase [Streptomyces sp. K1PN6]|uniref:GNAT family N-acetyltransferase n=1 Tax=Streptomyces acidicola TaxID=2596892 RepID=A0A5N8WTY1_9ACTN|nr:GNAT family N-acetyltransferase [Streptomyces acidicola]